ncbi:unnamed protein product [Notodromas monacha]|uniref:Uncharacterized protein n=1 Tax=Notodromas monacha TaxID=399045 RepID=A0A7R9BP38_9CRUS|nr:unnamed protein product [Notodromas monacha]CAG0918221.1 unnamed protein product [Notodromas monacha]
MTIRIAIRLLFLSLVFSSCGGQDAKSRRQEVQEILEHFKQADPVGIPGIPVPDPMSIKDFQDKFGIVRIKFKDAVVHNLSKFKIDYVSLDLHSMEISLGINVPEVEMTGHYELLTLFSKSKGPFSVILKDVFAEGKTVLHTPREARHLEAEKLELDMSFRKILVNFENLGLMTKVLRGIMSQIGPSVFNSIKPGILSQVEELVVKDLNAALKKIPFQFSHSIKPIDVAMIHACGFARDNKYDPFHVPEQHVETSFLSLNTSGMSIYGLSKVQRGDHVIVSLRNNTIEARVEISTEEVTGSSKYKARVLSIWDVEGEIAFEVDYVKVGIMVTQPLNLDQKMSLKDVDLEIGRVRITPLGDATSASFAERILQAAVGIISGTVRNMIACVAEEPIRQMVEELMQEVDVEKMVRGAALPEVMKLEFFGFHVGDVLVFHEFTEFLPNVSVERLEVDSFPGLMKTMVIVTSVRRIFHAQWGGYRATLDAVFMAARLWTMMEDGVPGYDVAVPDVAKTQQLVPDPEFTIHPIEGQY